MITRTLRRPVVIALVMLFSGSVIGPVPPSRAAVAGPVGGSLLAAPDLAGTTATNPNDMSSVEPARPDAGINLIEPPAANPLGDATLVYPIEIPPGRVGLQPDVKITYSSAGANGWLGMGWDMAVPSITVDTRWGVPRYLASQESETYLLNGEQLTPLAHRAEFADRPVDLDQKRFYPRVDENFERIVRYGSDPTSFWWQVTDKSGAVTTYGTESGVPDACAELDMPAAVLTDDPVTNVGNRFMWPVSEIRDSNGNTIVYCYERVAQPAVGSVRAGHQLYLTMIRYTGRDGERAAHQVAFERTHDRADAFVDARGGFKQVTDDLLTTIDIGSWDPGASDYRSVRSYVLGYGNGVYGKQLLRSITQYGAAPADGGAPSVFNRHTFEYFDNGTAFAGEDQWSLRNDRLGTWLLRVPDSASAPSAGLQSSAIAMDDTDQYGGSVYVGFAPAAPTKRLSGGVHAGYQYTTTSGVAELVDITGDRLPDKVFVGGDGACEVSALVAERSPATGEVSYGTQPTCVKGISDISDSSSHMVSVGPEVYFGAGAALTNHSWTWTKQSVYFLDVNGDGLVDLVDGKRVYFNRLAVEGNLEFGLESPVPFGSAPVDASRVIGDFSAEYEEQIDTFPLVDTLLRWIAPYAGTVDVSGQVQLDATAAERARDEYAQADGVRVAIQHESEELWHLAIGPDDLEPKPLAGIGGIAVEKGDVVYFRVQSSPDGSSDANGAFDRVAWSPVLRYRPTSVPAAADPNLLDPLGYSASDDFVLAGRRDIAISAPIDGTIHIGGTLRKGVTTDDVAVVITRNGRLQGDRMLLRWSETATISPSADIEVATGDEIRLRVEADSPIDLQQIEWLPTATYTDPVIRDEDGNAIPLAVDAPYDIETYPATSAAAPAAPWIAPITGTVSVTASLTAHASVEGMRDRSIVFTVKRAGALVSKDAAVIPPSPFFPHVSITATIDVVEGEEYAFDLSIRNPLLAAAINSSEVQVRWDGEPLLVRELAAATGMSSADVIAALSLPAPLAPVQTPAELLDSRGVSVATFVATVREHLSARLDALVANGDLDVARADGIVTRLAELLPWLVGQDARALVSGDVRAPWTLRTGYSDLDLWDVALTCGMTGGACIDGHLGKGLFPQPYRGWAYAAYDGNRARAAGPIDAGRLVVNDAEGASAQTAFPFAPFPLDPEHPDPADPQHVDPAWRGPDDLVLATAGRMSASRLGEDQLDVPSPDDILDPDAASWGRGIGVARSSVTTVNVGSGQAGPLSGSATIPGARNDSRADVDYLDANGDGYADIISGESGILTTLPWGAHTADWISLPGGDTDVRHSTLTAANAGFGGNAAMPTANARGRSGAKAGRSSAAGTSNSQKVMIGLGGSLGSGTSEVAYELADLNGDGLPDRIRRAAGGLEVALNLGYSFDGFRRWGSAQINAEANTEVAFSLGVNGGIYDYAAGISASTRISETERTLLDMNGDGLLDAVDVAGGKVAFNTGTGFATPVSVAVGSVAATNVTNGGGLYFTIPIGPLCLVACYVIVNPGGDYSRTASLLTGDLRDVDGDGLPDLVASESETNLSVSLNTTGKTNLLRTVARPLGGSFDLDYRREGNTTAMGDSRWALSSVRLRDGQPGDGPDSVTTFSYEDGRYDRTERTYYGFGAVTEALLNPDGSTYRSIERRYANDDYYLRGRLLAETTRDGDGRTFTETRYAYGLGGVATDPDLGTNRLTAPLFPELRRIEERFYEGRPAFAKSTSRSFRYDDCGNLARIEDLGEPGGEDDVITVLAYPDCDSTPYLVDQPLSEVVTGGGTPMRSTDATYDPVSGLALTVRSHLTEDEAAITELAYDAYGNVTRATGPANDRGQRFEVTYRYDEAVHTFPIRTEDSFGYASTATYDPRFGVPTVVTDINGQSTTYAYDLFGRLTSVVGPYEVGTGRASLTMAYHPDETVPWALTRRVDVARGGDDIETSVFLDGLARLIQTKADAAVAENGGPSRDVTVVSGALRFDVAGRQVAQHFPRTDELANRTTFTSEADPTTPIRATYDVLDRLTAITDPDGATTTFEYGFGTAADGSTQFLERSRNANAIPVDTYRNVRNEIVGVRELNAGGAEEIWTTYAYDPLGQVTRVVDDAGNTTSVTYDTLGRRTRVDNPDTGAVETVFDLASNPVERITARLRGEGKVIRYGYDYTRLSSITYPDYPDSNVAYAYGTPGAASNRAGRLVSVSDGSGSEEFWYGPLGEVVRTTKTVTSKTQGGSANSPELYTTQFRYDTWNRMLSMTYPDGEQLDYEYDSGGAVTAVSGTKEGRTYPYVLERTYDKFGVPVSTRYGNGVRTEYAYDPLTRCLDSIDSRLGSAPPFQALRIACDKVRNIRSVASVAPDPSPAQFGAATAFTYSYDDLGRLVHAEGTARLAPSTVHAYRLDLSYDSTHNLIAKTQRHTVSVGQASPIVQKADTYDWRFEYAAGQPHAASHVGDRTFTYDPDGNQTGWTSDTNGTRQRITWDEEGRVRAIEQNGRAVTFRYNAAGDRVTKQGPLGETTYVNPFFTVRNREVGIKHVYVGDGRIADKFMRQDKPGSNPSGNSPNEGKLYFYHADQLGSTNYVTDEAGGIYQHFEYLPSGELFVEEATTDEWTPYRFTSTEVDAETGLYAMGARYYEPRASTWLSPDPMLDGYLGSADPGALPGYGGQFNSRNLNLYGYAAVNPVGFRDPSGTDVRSLIAYWYGRERAHIVREAQWSQGGRWYAGGIDAWEGKMLRKGTLLLAAVHLQTDSKGVRFVGQSGFFVEFRSPEEGSAWMARAKARPPSAWEHMEWAQISLGEYSAPRSHLAVYEVPQDTVVAFSEARVNRRVMLQPKSVPAPRRQIVAGGAPQVYMGDFWKTVRPIAFFETRDWKVQSTAPQP